jgi:selenide,water dikinase
LILTKPIGSGVLFNAQLNGKLEDQDAFDFCIETVSTLNRAAAETFSEFEIHAATDVTGFGLGGHGLEMAGEDTRLHLSLDAIPVMPHAYRMYAAGVTTGVNKHNRTQVEPHLSFSDSVESAKREILFDPQTSGGLLVALPASQAADALSRLNDNGVPHACIIGHTETATDAIRIAVS